MPAHVADQRERRVAVSKYPFRLRLTQQAGQRVDIGSELRQAIDRRHQGLAIRRALGLQRWKRRSSHQAGDVGPLRETERGRMQHQQFSVRGREAQHQLDGTRLLAAEGLARFDDRCGAGHLDERGAREVGDSRAPRTGGHPNSVADTAQVDGHTITSSIRQARSSVQRQLAAIRWPPAYPALILFLSLSMNHMVMLLNFGGNSAREGAPIRPRSFHSWTNRTDVKLTPQIPPGRSNRKAREYTAEIARLRIAGYGCRAIREALAEVGVVVSKTTVHRELAKLAKSSRLSKPVPAIHPPSPAAVQTVAPQPHPAGPALPQPLPKRRSGQEVAEEFMKGQITNPLFRNRAPK